MTEDLFDELEKTVYGIQEEKVDMTRASMAKAQLDIIRLSRDHPGTRFLSVFESGRLTLLSGQKLLEYVRANPKKMYVIYQDGKIYFENYWRALK